MATSTEISKAIDEAIEKINARIDGDVDRELLKNLKPTMEELMAKREAGTLSLKDFATLLRVCKHVLVPLARKQQVSRLEAIKDMVRNGPMGIS